MLMEKVCVSLCAQPFSGTCECLNKPSEQKVPDLGKKGLIDQGANCRL